MEFMYVRLKDKIKSGDISNSFTNVTTHFLKKGTKIWITVILAVLSDTLVFYNKNQRQCNISGTRRHLQKNRLLNEL